jgi:deoxycytidine triphosphate deaminase
MAEYNPRYMWVVPPEDKGGAGTLLSDRIRLYIDAVHLIEPRTFVEKELRPASYDLHVGNEYYVCRRDTDGIDKDKRVPLEENRQLEIPANGLVYIATQEEFNIPYYMVARYSLQVTQVYRGLLIENGLQIDPGYHGRVVVAVHNFTNQPRSLARGHPFLSIEFGRTTQLPGDVEKIETEADLVAFASGGKLRGVDNKRVLLFTQRLEDLRKERTPWHFWNKNPGERHKSSILGMQEDLKQENKSFQDQVEKKVSRVENVSLVAFIGLVIALFAALWPWVSERYLRTELAVRPIEEKLKVAEREVQELQERMDILEKEFHGLASARGGMPQGANPGSAVRTQPKKAKP